MGLLLKLASALFVGLLVYFHITSIRYYLRLPAYCSSPGMEPYYLREQCALDLGPGFEGVGFVKHGMQLLDGAPPKPIHWADFQGLYELQRRMIERMINATVYTDPITLQTVSRDVLDNKSAIHQFREDFRRRDYRKERVLREALFMGGRLGSALNREYRRTKLNLENLVASNRGAAEGVEKAMDKQPRNFLSRAMADLFPRSRSSIWSWDTAVEVRWQYYDSFTSFSWELYDTLLALSELLPQLEAYQEDLKNLNMLFIQEPIVNNTLPSAHHRNTTSPPSEEDKRHEAMKRTIVEGLTNAGRVARDRVGAALIELRALSEELESARHRVAEPDRHIPLYVHLRHIYVQGAKLSAMLEGMK